MSSGTLSPQRIHAIDAIRGFCLLNIFVNHVTMGFLRGFSPSRIMFSDSAEAFVFLAGISCFLAYGPRVEGPGGGPSAASNSSSIWRSRIWARARTLFLANTLIALLSIVMLLIAGNIAAPADPALFPSGLIAANGLGSYLWHVLTMQETVGYSVVLRLYVVLMLVGPFYIWLAGKRFWYPLIPAGLLWAIAGHFSLAESNSLSGVPLALTLLPWNLVFAAGIALGAGIAQRQTLPKSNVPTIIAAMLVVTGPICFVLLTRLSPDVLAWVDTRNDFFWTGASKSLQSPLRVAYMLALAYLFMALRHTPIVRLVHQVSPNNPLAILGRRSLEVFTAGAIMALAADQALWALVSHGILSANSFGAITIEIAMFALATLAMLRIARSKRWTADAIGATISEIMRKTTSSAKPVRG